MKKIFCFLLAALIGVTFIGAFTGCGGAQEITCKVTFDMDGTCENVVIEVKKGEGIAKENVPEPPVKEGYTVKWAVTDFSRITGDLFVKPVYTKIGEVEPIYYTVTFVFENAADVVLTVEAGCALSDSDVPEPPAKEGYTVKWDREDFSDITENVTVRPVYTLIEIKTVKVNFLMGKGGKTYVWASWVDSMTFVIGVEYSLPILNPASGYGNHYEFVGWNYDGKEVELRGTFDESFTGKEVTFVLNYAYNTNNY